MAQNPDDPLILLEILEVLGACHGSVSYADICVYLSGRFSLQPLLDLRSLLYSIACKDPCFPSTLFRERLHPPCSNRLSATADVVSLFNLLMHTRMAPTYAQNVQTLTPCQVCGKGFLRYEWPTALPIAGGGTASDECKYENLPCQVISLNTEASHAQAHPHSYMHNQESMQNTHSVDPFSDEVNPEAAKTPKANQEARIVRSCSQKRSAFKDGFRNLVPLISMEASGQSEQSPDGPREDGEDLLSITQKNPYPDPQTYTDDDHTCSPASHMECLHDDSYIYASLDPMTVTHEVNVQYVDAPNPYSPGQTQWHQTKHESLDELQTSTYFGPPVDHQKLQAPALQVKSHSLDIDSRTADERPEPEKSVLQKPRSERSVLEKSGLRKPGSVKISFDGSSFDIPGFDPRIVSSVRDTFKRLSSISLDAWCDWSPSADGVASVGTQTEQADRRALRSLMLSEKLSIDNPDIAEDDISAIFRFLDDISMCGSMAVLPGEGGGVQEGGGAGLPERRERLGKLRKLFHSLEAPEEGVRWGVGRLLQRVTELEQRLEPITELREQLALVLSTLDRLEQREQIACPHLHQMHIEQQPPARPNIQQQGSPRINPGAEGANEAAAKRRHLFVRRASRSHTESGSSEAHREWSISFSKEPHIQPVKSDQLGGVYKRDYPIPQEVMGFHLMPTEAQKAQRRTSVQSTSQNLADRPKVTWSQSDLTPLELQAPESLEFWTDEIYTPASDTLLRRSQSYTRCNRNQAYRIAALSITATIILILIIVIPVSTM
ncbi:major intrinsically disordered Notch2-binding receptor 1-like [Myxocyprinus asiaticus]|uniref:major intrinsically disordered Notch2-binding receptor 1-like n=1 Tax=Myxocyprinus asiaticus TaxID=70543 RepID=UPI002221E7F6|nr:major intrinsically disordered Notch2-binding receptor 1-like [Myxocyprinus asiaticus]